MTRFEWALEELGVRPTDRVLEIGCGHGIALAMVAARLTTGSVLGVDRSAKMIAIGKQKALTKVTLREGDIETVDLGPGRFDLVFAINVSLFARAPAGVLAKLKGCLKPAGRLVLFYEAPPGALAGPFERAARRNLEANGYRVESKHRGRRAVVSARSQ